MQEALITQTTTEKETILSVRALKVSFKKRKREVTPIRNVSFDVYKGEILGIVGESGSGKSLTAKSIVGLVGKRHGECVSGEIKYKDNDLVKKTDREMRRFRGKEIAMIFQDPMTSLNPTLSIGYQVAEVPRIHQNDNKETALNKAVHTLTQVGIPSARQRLKQYPHQFSGGMRQRVVSAISLICSPKLLIADEPTTALDVTIQNQFLKLLLALKEKLDTSIILITHDLGVVAKMCDRVMVMYAGQIIEEAPSIDLFEAPKHPYTLGLLASVPVLHATSALNPIEGHPPSPSQMPKGCAFHPRCPHVMEKCTVQVPVLRKVSTGHRVACFLGEIENE